MKPAHFPDLKSYLAGQENKSLLRFLTCGSVDDGKSTLIGRLLFDSKLIFEDHLAALAKDSRKHGTTGDDIDLALLVDGLEAERQQGITIDVAYRYFSTEKRKFIVADTPGHEQYTRNMATGASNSELAVILVDARKGVLTQTRRHAYIASLLRIHHVVLAVNKIDLVDFSENVFHRIAEEFGSFAAPLDFKSLVAIPLSARYGDNVIAPSPRTPWYRGRRCWSTSKSSMWRGNLRRGRFGCPCSGLIALISTFAGSAARSRAARFHKATQCSPPIPGGCPTWPALLPMTAISRPR
jgi:bifunctional enzyme CysN/CysC